MTEEERKTAASKEIRELLDRAISQEKRLVERLKERGELSRGLDGNTNDYAPLRDELTIKLKTILQKYDLPPDTKIKLW